VTIYAVNGTGLFQQSLVSSVAIRKHIKMRMYRETLLTSMGMFGDKRGDFGNMYSYSSGLSFLQELLADTLVTSRHNVSF